MASTNSYSCSQCGNDRTKLTSTPYGKYCQSCVVKNIGYLMRKIEHRPTYTEVATLVQDVIRPLAERITAIELALGGMNGTTPTQAAEQLLLAGSSNREVSAELGLTSLQVKQIKFRLKGKQKKAVKPRELTGWAKLRAGLAAERGEVCEICRKSFATKLRRITFERGDDPTEDDVRFLCDGCHDTLKPIPFYEEFIQRTKA